MNVEIHNERFPAIVGDDVTIERLGTGYQFTEGPIWHPYERHLTFSDIPGNQLWRWSASGGITSFRDPSNKTNGNTYDRTGRMLSCEHATSRVTRTEPDGSITILATHYLGKELNSPNDIVVRSDGTIYFTDPIFGRYPGFGIEREPELGFRGVYRMDQDGSNLTLLADDFGQPNGLCLSTDENSLFVNDTERRHIRVFAVGPNGLLTGGEILAEIKGDGDGAPDGMKVDRDNNLYCTGPGGLHVLTSDGELLGIIKMPEKTANFTWGDDDMMSIFPTASTSLYRVRTRTPGIPLF